MVEWSEQLRSVTSVWLGAVRRRVQIRLCPGGKRDKNCYSGFTTKVNKLWQVPHGRHILYQDGNVAVGCARTKHD